MSKPSQRKKWVLIPIEIKAREFESRILLSCFAAEAGYGVVLGRQPSIHKYIKYLPKGLFFDKSISANKLERIKQRSQLGNITVCIDEEGLGADLNDFYARTRVSEETLQQTSILYAWGDCYVEMLTKQYPKYIDKVLPTGNPRVDLWRKEFRGIYGDKRREIAERYGKYIFFPTNFSRANNAVGVDRLKQRSEKYGRIQTTEDEKWFNEYTKTTRDNFEQFTAAIPVLSEEFSGLNIVIRPHPAEDHSHWLKLAENLPNVFVAYEGGVTPWIAQAELSFHHGCTTGVEAYVLDTPSVSYQPVPEPHFERRLSNRLLPKASDIDGLITHMRSILAGNYQQPADADKIASFNISSLEGAFAGEKMVEAFSVLDWPEDELSFPVHRVRINKGIDSLFNAAKKRLRNSRNDEASRLAERRKAYSMQKFPGSTLHEVNAVINALRAVSGRFSDVQAYELTEGVYCVVS